MHSGQNDPTNAQLLKLKEQNFIFSKETKIQIEKSFKVKKISKSDGVARKQLNKVSKKCQT